MVFIQVNPFWLTIDMWKKLSFPCIWVNRSLDMGPLGARPRDAEETVTDLPVPV
jgi:hypothetical protein